MNRNTSSDLQTPATDAAADHAAGVGGSYSIDKGGNVSLNHRTEPARVSRKAPGVMLHTPEEPPASSADHSTELA